MSGPYNVILADPPWRFNSTPPRSNAAKHYATMSVDELAALDVAALAADDCALFMWWVASQPREALKLVDAWGFSIKTMTAFSWIKKTSTGKKDHFGTGHSTRQQQEHCLVARRGRSIIVDRGVRQNIRACVRKHSQKPDEIYSRIETLCGDVPRLELFARDYHDGWHVWGDEVWCDVTIAARAA